MARSPGSSSLPKRFFSSRDFAPAALIGGLAVMIRVGSAHRATVDVDTVTGGEAPGALLLDYVGEGATANGLIVDGVVVDVLPTEALPDDADGLPDDERQRLFLLAHRWALETADAATVRAVGPDPDSVPEIGRLIVATAPALVACKLHALSDRHGSGLAKRESDASDLVQLVGHLVRGDRSAGFRGAPFDLIALVRAHVERGSSTTRFGSLAGPRWLTPSAGGTARHTSRRSAGSSSNGSTPSTPSTVEGPTGSASSSLTAPPAST